MMKSIFCIFFLFSLSASEAADFEDLELGTLIEIQYTNGDDLEGKLLSIEVDRLSIRTHNVERLVGLNQIAKIYRLEKKSRKRGAIRGLWIGAAVGVGLAFATKSDDFILLGSFVFFTPIAVGAGAAIGAHIPGHNKILVFENPKARAGMNSGSIPKRLCFSMSVKF